MTPAHRVSIQNVPVCTGTTRTCFNTRARGAGTHGDVLNVHAEAFFESHVSKKIPVGRIIPPLTLTLTLTLIHIRVHTHIHMHIHTYTITRACSCACACARVRGRGGRGGEWCWVGRWVGGLVSMCWCVCVVCVLCCVVLCSSGCVLCVVSLKIKWSSTASSGKANDWRTLTNVLFKGLETQNLGTG